MSDMHSGTDTSSGPDRDADFLLRALDTADIFSVPVEIWITIATALAPDGVEYRAADAESFSRAHPDQVDRHQTSHYVRYGRSPASRRDAIYAATAVPSTVKDNVALALVGLLRQSAADPGVRHYLLKYLPAHCAAGEGRGIDALRAMIGEPDVDRLLAAALERRGALLPPPEGVILRREAIARFEAAGYLSEALMAHGSLSAWLEQRGDIEGAVREMEQMLLGYRRLSTRDQFQFRFVAVAQLNLGRLYHEAGRRQEAIAAAKDAVEQFRLLVMRDDRFSHEFLLAQAQLSKIRWRR